MSDKISDEINRENHRKKIVMKSKKPVDREERRHDERFD